MQTEEDPLAWLQRISWRALHAMIETLPPGHGRLNFNMEFVDNNVGKNFIVLVSAHDTLEKQHFMFIHEVVHIFLLSSNNWVDDTTKE